jgi:lipoate-protein ligase B
LFASIEKNTLENPWGYADAIELCKKSQSEFILYSEMKPTVTVGRRDASGGFLLNRADLVLSGVDIVETTRGGFVTWHGPGQWVVFPHIQMQNYFGDSRSVARLICVLLDAALVVTKKYRLDAVIESGERLGIWTSQGKLVSIGVSIEDGWVRHGLAFNVLANPQSFLGILPCGLKTRPDFLVDESKLKSIDEKEICMDKVRGEIHEEISNVLGSRRKQFDDGLAKQSSR